MKRLLIKAVVLIIIFACAVTGFSFMLNIGEARSTTDVKEPELPVLMIKYEGANINKMYGFAGEMDEVTLRDSITLIPYDRNLSVYVDCHNNDIKELNYQVSSVEDHSILENGRIKSIEPDGDNLVGNFHIENPITMGQEYMLRFDVKLGNGETYYYYTRIVQRNGQNLSWYIDYTLGFSANCISKNLTDDMIKQLEPMAEAVNSSLHTVNIHSDYDRILWGNLTPEIVKQPVPTVNEINETTVSISLDFVVSTIGETGKKEFYNVKEYYRMRKDQDYVVLLNYDRDVDQIFDGNLPVLKESGINLGVIGKDVDFVTNDTVNIAAFIQSGEIWEYNRTANKVTRIFTLRSDNHDDDRNEHLDYGVTISSVDEDGSVVFIVYGYMNKGLHEGKNGIALFRYDQVDNTTAEMMFIETDQSYDILKRNISKLAYVNDNQQCFLYYGDKIVNVNLADQSTYVVQDNLDWNSFSVSDSQKLVAWAENSGTGSKIVVLNLDTSETLKIDAPKNENIRIIGFVGEDVVYGLVNDSDIFTDEVGALISPMYRLCLMNGEGSIVKDYQVNGVFITDAYREDSIIKLKRFLYDGQNRIPISDDSIVYYQAEKENSVSVKLSVDERKGTEVGLAFTIAGKTSGLLTLYSRYIVAENPPELSFERVNIPQDEYYVYSKGRLYNIYPKLNAAIAAANEQYGVVLNARQQYVWERGNYKQSIIIDPTTIPKGLLSAPIEENSVASAVGSGYTVWNLSECTLESLKYQLSSGYPVCAKWSPTESVLILGYDQFENIWLYNPENGEPKAVAIEEAKEAFESCGNVFLSYHLN